MAVFEMELDAVSTTFFCVETQPCEQTFRRGVRVQFHLFCVKAIHKPGFEAEFARQKMHPSLGHVF